MALMIAVLQFLLTWCGTVLAKTPFDGIASTRLPEQPPVKVVLVILENRNADSALDRQHLPFLWRLAHEGAYLSRYHAIAHPSQPNYVALISGSTEGVRGNSPARLDRPHLGQQLQSWMSYAEGYPSGTCDTRTKIGRYVRKHQPFLSFADIQDDPRLCRQHITGFDAFIDAARAHRLPSFSLVIPNLDHDAHDKSLSEADAWLERNFGPLLDDAEFRRDVILIVTFDENDEQAPYLEHSDNRVYAALWGNHVLPSEVKIAYDHYDLLRTIEAIFHLAPMSAGDGNAKVIGGIWR